MLRATGAPTSAGERVIEFDVARSLAILGMVVVHFSLVMAADHAGPAWLNVVLGFLDGRAAATFVVLATAGVTLASRRRWRAATCRHWSQALAFWHTSPEAIRRDTRHPWVFIADHIFYFGENAPSLPDEYISPAKVGR